MVQAFDWKTKPPDLIADVTLYPTEEGGKKQPIVLGWGCPCMVSLAQPLVGYDARLQLGEASLAPGSGRRVGFVFLSPEGAETIRRAGRFFLWEGHAIGEAVVIQ